MEENPNDIVLCGCVCCRSQTRQRRRIAEDHVRRYGAEDFDQYATWFESQVEGMSTGISQRPHFEMTPDPRAALVHHRDARRQAMAGVASTSADHIIGSDIEIDDIEKDEGFETGIEDMLNDFFCDVLPGEDVGVNEEAKKRQERESEIKEQCNKLLFEGAKVSKLRVLLGLLNLQTIYGWSDVSVTALFQLLRKILPEGNCMPESRTEAKKTLATLGLDYEGIHACPNDHVLFKKELAN